ncbi:MAG: biotin--[acetyl-CoA-carboxylase] ligase [Rhodobacteraceae bacterium]|nr:MAG: biotin--[acetyl-CoA-carboxylase] ligase [Paracoccaceae bacterium]
MRLSWPAGVGLVALDEVDSTNEEARRRGDAGVEGPLWIMARRQTAARGRRGRGWSAPEGNLSATCLLRPEIRVAEAALLSFAACLAVAEFFESASPGANVSLKWPNDVLLNGRKAAGVLLESAGGGGRLDWLAVGVGVNLAHHPAAEEGAWPPTSVRAEAGLAPTPEAALERIAARFAHWSDVLAARGFAPLRDAWLARAARLGEKIEARLPRETVTGVFADLDSTGALVLSTAAGPRRIQAADVFFA